MQISSSQNLIGKNLIVQIMRWVIFLPQSIWVKLPISPQSLLPCSLLDWRSKTGHDPLATQANHFGFGEKVKIPRILKARFTPLVSKSALRKSFSIGFVGDIDIDFWPFGYFLDKNKQLGRINRLDFAWAPGLFPLCGQLSHLDSLRRKLCREIIAGDQAGCLPRLFSCEFKKYLAWLIFVRLARQ